MNSKERVKAVLDRKTPDQIPFGEFAIDYDTVEKILGHETYLRAKAKSQIAFWEGRRDEVAQSMKEDTVELFRKLGCLDIVNLAAMMAGTVPPKGHRPENPPRRVDDTTWEDKEGRVYKYSDITADITVIQDPTIWDPEYNPEDFILEIQKKPDPSIFEVTDYVTEQLGKEFFIIGPSGGEAGMLLLGNMERGLTEYLTNPDGVKAAIDKATSEANQNDYFYLQDGFDATLWGNDFAYNAGPFLPPHIFREFCLPSITERVAHVKKFGKYVLKHACGNNWDLLDMFVEAGYDCYQSIQQSGGMILEKVEALYGGKICLWGGLPVEHLVSGTREDIRNDVQAISEIAFKKPGYIFGSSHSIAVGTKYDNFMTMLDEFDKVKQNC